MIPATAVEPKLFISYSSSDADFATAVADALAGRGFQPWLDKREIRPGDSFLERMNDGLHSASYILLLVSAASSASRWVQREWMSALAKAGTVIVPVLLDDSEVPQLLKDIVYIDARLDRAKAINQIVAFFERETAPPKPPALRSDKVRVPVLETMTRRQLRLIASGCMEASHLRSFCFDADVEETSLRGESVQEKLISLQHTVSAEGLERKFTRWLELERPKCVAHQIEVLRGTPGWDWTTA